MTTAGDGGFTLPGAPAWFRFARGGAVHLGGVDPEAGRWFDLGPLDPHALLLRGALGAEDLAARLTAAAEMAAPDRILQPLPRPGKILCLAKNYVAHAREMGGDAPAEPIFFAKLPDTLCGPGDPVIIPEWLDTRVDHEAELALILGFEDPEAKGRKDVYAADAPGLVAGYTALNDVTARKLQGQDREHKYPWLRSKSLDTFCPFGPFVVPRGAIDPNDLQITMRVNGEVRQQARTSAMVFSTSEAVAAMSRVTTLRPGDLIAMGTPEGVSAVVHGDVMEVEVEQVGVLRNVVLKAGELTRGRILALCAAVAAIWIFVLATSRPVPSEDGVWYLWMAQQFAAGEWGSALSMVFPPGFPLLVAPLIAAGCPAEGAADAVNIVAFALTVWPLAAIARRLTPHVRDADVATCLLFISGSLLSRVAAEVYSEPLFLLLMAWGTAAGLAGRHWLTGTLAGIAFWIRPEGLLLALSFTLAGPRAGWRALPGAAVGVLLLAVTRGLAGQGFDPLPILDFHELRDDLPQRGAVFANLLDLPGAWLEAFGVVGVVLLVWAVPKARRALPRVPALWWQIALQVGVVLTFVVRRRFLLSCAVPVIALAGAALARLRLRLRGPLMLLAVLAGVIGAFRGGIDTDRLAERDLGIWIGAWLEPGERVTGDLTRVLWYAGQRPLPPRHFDTDQLRAMAAAGDVRYFVFSSRSKRESSRQIEAELTDTFGRVEIPEPVGSRCADRGIVLLERR